MEAKWPFMLITFGLIFALGLTIAGLERTAVMNNWSTRRCEIPVMMAAMFFKPQSDSRSSNDFAKDNFDFCMKTYIENFMTLFMAPIHAIFGKQMDATGNAVNVMSTLRNIATTLYNTLLTYLDQYYRRFNASVYEMSRITQYLRMAMRRANAMAMSMLYSGITIFRGMLNTIQFVIKVIMIIVGIMLAIIIILIFILFPVIPLILAVLGAIVATVLSLSLVMTGEIAQQAEADKGGFCFSSWTLVSTLDKNGKEIIKPISELNVGDELGYNCGKITTVIKMDGNNVSMYYLDGIFVSGSHLVKGTDGVWKSVAQDERAKKTHIESPVLYCFNTTTRTIPIHTNSDSKVILFRDWEEIDEEDKRGQLEWNYVVLSMLNKYSNYNYWKQNLACQNIPIVSSNTLIKTIFGFIPIESIELGNNILLDKEGKKQRVLGLVRGDIENVQVIDNNKTWNTELYELDKGVWIRGKSNIIEGNDVLMGVTIITESGEFIIWDEGEQKEKIVRDFTEVGYKSIHKTYPFVANRLRTSNQVR